MEGKAAAYIQPISKQTINFTDSYRHIPQAAHVFCMRLAGRIPIPYLEHRDSSVTIDDTQWEVVLVVDDYALLQHESQYMLAHLEEKDRAHHRVLRVISKPYHNPIFSNAHSTYKKIGIFALLLEDYIGI